MSPQNEPESPIGVGLRHPHYHDLLNAEESKLPIDFIEVHAENFFAKGGAAIHILHQVRSKLDISIHGTSLGLGSQVALPDDVLTSFSQLVSDFQPKYVSEHLCFNRAVVGGKVMHSSDLLPIAYTPHSLRHVCEQINRVQDSIKRPLFIENLSAYLSADQLIPDIQTQQMDEIEFLISMCQISGCFLLLDLNNLLINELNKQHYQGRSVDTDPIERVSRIIDRIPSELVGEIHLAGYSKHPGLDVIIDDHGAPVSDECWTLFSKAIDRFGTKPTLIEWDTHIPAWPVLLEQASIARKLNERQSTSELPWV